MIKKFKDSYLSYIFMYFGYYLAMASFSSVLSVYLSGIGKSDQELSLILSAAGIFSLIVAPVAGYLNDRAENPKTVTAVFLTGTALLALVFSACREVWLLFLLNGVIMSLINSVTSVCERVAGDSKYRYGILRIWGTLGYASGAQVAGLAIEHLPGYALFLLVASACGLCLLGLWGVQLRPVRPKNATPQSPREKPRLSALLESPPFFLFLAAAFLFSGCSGVNMNYSPMLLTGMGVSTGAVGTVLFFSTLVEIPLILFSHKFMDRLSGKTLTAICFVLAMGQYLVYGLAGSPWVVIGVMVAVKAVASTLYMMLSLKMVRCLIPAELTTTGLAVVGSVNSLAGIVLQNAGGWLVSLAGIPAMYLCLSLLCAAGLVLTLFLRVRNDEKVFG